MIPKSGYRFSEKIMLKQEDWRATAMLDKRIQQKWAPVLRKAIKPAQIA
jgi:hypothetical protein